MLYNIVLYIYIYIHTKKLTVSIFNLDKYLC